MINNEYRKFRVEIIGGDKDGEEIVVQGPLNTLRIPKFNARPVSLLMDNDFYDLPPDIPTYDEYPIQRRLDGTYFVDTLGRKAV